MYSKRDFMIFVAGALALHGFVNLLFKYSGLSPVKMYGYLVNPTAILISVTGCIVLLWWADKLGKPQASFWKWW
jgi:hypothetical protein